MFSDPFLVSMEMSLASILVRLSQVISTLPKSEEDKTWWVELGTTEQGAMKLMEGEVWCLAEDTQRGSHILPVMATRTPMKLQLYIEKDAS